MLAKMTVKLDGYKNLFFFLHTYEIPDVFHARHARVYLNTRIVHYIVLRQDMLRINAVARIFTLEAVKEPKTISGRGIHL